jgi:uncharacterized membrane protein
MTATGIPTRGVTDKAGFHYNRIAGRGLERLCALSDGVFAIAMTLIVLEIRVPSHIAVQTETALWGAIAALAPRITTYFLSFLTLGIFWVGQQTQLNQFARVNRNLTWVHLAFLSFVAIMPFSTGLLAEFTTFRVALLVYWANIALLGVVIYASWAYAERAGLLKDEVSADVGRAIRKRVLTAQALYAIGAVLCVISTYWSIGFIVLVQLNYAIAPKIPGLWKLTA